MRRHTIGSTGPLRCSMVAGVLAAFALAVGGCNPCQRIADRHDRPAPATLPTYPELADQYNANLELLPRLWSKAQVRLTWRDEHDKRQAETLDGKLIADLPDRVTLTLGKLDFDKLWIGSNEERYWAFDLHNNPRRVWYGRHTNVSAARDDLPLSIPPRYLPDLLGVVPLPIPEGRTPTVDWLNSAYAFVVPGRPIRLYVDPKTRRPVRVDVLDATGEPTIVARLGCHKGVRVEREPKERWPQVARRVEATLVGRDAEVVLTLEYPNTDADRVKPRLFDLDFLMERYHKIDPANRIDLDAPVPGPQP